MCGIELLDVTPRAMHNTSGICGLALGRDRQRMEVRSEIAAGEPGSVFCPASIRPAPRCDGATQVTEVTAASGRRAHGRRRGRVSAISQQQEGAGWAEKQEASCSWRRLCSWHARMCCCWTAAPAFLQRLRRACRWLIEPAQQGLAWCPRRDSNPRPQDSSHFGFRRHPREMAQPFARKRLWSGLSLRPGPRLLPRPLGAARPVSTPSEACAAAWLGIGMAQAAEAFPDFERIHGAVSGRRAQFRNQESCAPLRPDPPLPEPTTFQVSWFG